METHSTPQITASLSIHPATHSFSNPQAPTLTLTLTSHHPDPITIYADDLSPTLMLATGALVITDLSTGSPVRQSIRTHCRLPPPSKVSVPLHEHLFHTLLPQTPLPFSAPFTRAGGGKPLPKHDPAYATRRSAGHGACGVDGLEPGHRYALSLAGAPRVPWNVVRWWEFGTREQVLSAGGEPGGLDGRKVRFGAGPHAGIVLDLASVGVLGFECWG